MADLFSTSIPVLLEQQEPRRVFSSVRSGEENAALYTFSRWPCSKVRGTPVSFLCDGTDLATLRELWEENLGGGVAIDFRWPYAQDHVRLWVCEFYVADLPIDLPIYDGSDHEFVNLLTGAVIAGHTVTTGGTNGRDKLTAWSVAPDDGTLLGLNVTGQLQLLVRMSGEFAPVTLGDDAYQLSFVLDEI